MQANKNTWLCVRCGHLLGNVSGGELYPAPDAVHVHTAGPNLEVTCPDCGSIKTWYTADPVVRAIYQLIDAMTTASARSMINQLGRAIHTELPDVIQQAVQEQKK